MVTFTFAAAGVPLAPGDELLVGDFDDELLLQLAAVKAVRAASVSAMTDLLGKRTTYRV